MNIRELLTDLFSTKASPIRAVSVISQVGKPVMAQRNLENFSREGYQKNVVAFTAISRIARAASQIPWELFSKTNQGELTQIMDHPLLTLIKHPNPMMGQDCFFEALTAFYWISGNTFINLVDKSIPDEPGLIQPPTSEIKEMYVVRPDRMKVVPWTNGFPGAYDFTEQGHTIRFMVDHINMNSAMVHIKTFHPRDLLWGMSPIEAAALAVDQNNESSMWNLALLQNSAQPSGNFTVEMSDKNPMGKIEKNQRDDIEAEFRRKYAGPRNTGRPMVLAGGLKWQQMGLKPKDMDWIKGKNSSAREVANALGYPPMLLGIEGDNTFNNQKEARLSLYEDTILPWMEIIASEFNTHIAPHFGDNLVLKPNPDMLPALAFKRQMIWDSLNSVQWMTDNEKREQAGFEPIDNPLADEVFKSATQIPLSQMGELDDDEDDDEPDDDPFDDDEEDDEDKMQQKAPEDLFGFFVQNWIEQRGAEKITQIHGVTKEKVIRGIRDSIVENANEPVTVIAKEIQKSVEKTYSGMSRARSIAIARTETLMASSQGSLEAARDLRIPNMNKEWVPSNDDRSRDTHRQMQGVKIPIDDKFSVPSKVGGNTEMDGPGDPTAGADQLVNCRCVLVYSRSIKLFNLRSASAKRAFWLKTNRRRQRDAKRFRTGIRRVFRQERDDLVKAFEGLRQLDQVETIIASVLNKNEPLFINMLANNYRTILNRFAKEVFKIGDGDV